MVFFVEGRRHRVHNMDKGVNSGAAFTETKLRRTQEFTVLKMCGEAIPHHFFKNFRKIAQERNWAIVIHQSLLYALLANHTTAYVQ